MNRINELLKQALTQHPALSTRHEIEMILAHVLERDRAWLFAHADEPISPQAFDRFNTLLTQRQRGVPLAYLLGQRGFWTLDLKVNESTLIPRPETELLVEIVITRLAQPLHGTWRIADLGTGSGAIALAIAQALPLSDIIATDFSQAALDVARENALRHAIGNVDFRRGDWFDPLADEQFDVIVSNPPYIAHEDPHLLCDGLNYEPISALVSGKDGLDAIRVIAANAVRHLNPGGLLAVEHGWNQGGQVRKLLRQGGLIAVETRRDLEERERVTLGEKPRMHDAPE